VSVVCLEAKPLQVAAVFPSLTPPLNGVDAATLLGKEKRWEIVIEPAGWHAVSAFYTGKPLKYTA
jgi:hypothetical protein